MFGESERTRKARKKIGMPTKASGKWGYNLKPSTARPLIAFALIGYPVAAIMRLTGDALLSSAGLLLFVAVAIASIPVFASRMQKIVGEEGVPLDEYELTLRHRSLSTAYYIFAVIVVGSIMYAGIAKDIGWWLPTTDKHWNGLFWGAALYAVMIPTAVLAFRSKDPVDDGEG